MIKIKAMEWIKISEKLPKLGQDCIIYSEFHGIEFDFEFQSDCFYDNNWDKTRLMNDIHIACNITHWMPVPEPPK